ncbi:MAG: type II CRISPR RNA-guided endonuclease Cas9 [Bacteroidota bacterium]
MSIILGLDVGARSIGWALVNLDQDPAQRTIIDAGVRVFKAGVENMNSKQEASRNVERTQKRGSRRNGHRKALRKRAVLKWLDAHGFIELQAGVSLSEVESHLPAEFFSLDPYRLRYEALQRALRPLEFARVMFHLAHRRGFLSNRKIKDDEKEGGSLKQEFDHLESLWEDHGTAYPTWGAFCYGVLSQAIAVPEDFPLDLSRIRKKHTRREWYESEFDAIWAKQSACATEHPEVFNEDKRKELRDSILFYQRPMQDVQQLVGYCTFEYQNKEKRLAWGHPLAQRFRMLSDLNQLQVARQEENADQFRPLDPNERAVLGNKLSTVATPVKVAAIRKLLEKTHPGGTKLRTNRDESTTVRVMKPLATWYRLRKIFGGDLTEATAQALFETWEQNRSDPETRAALRQKFPQFKSEQIEAFLNFRPEAGYCRLGKTAISRIIPHLETGLPYSEACRRAGYNHSIPEALEAGKYRKLPSLDKFFRKYHPQRMNNPNVRKVLNELRRVVNAVINHYGHPETIRIELARELSQPLERRLRKSKTIRDNFERNEKARTELAQEIDAAGLRVDRITRKLVRRYQLWEEQGRRCIYSGQSIGFRQLLISQVDIDHIVPYSRRPEDGYHALVLTTRELNAEKGNRTPWEWLGGDPQRWAQFEAVVGSLRKNNGYPFSKEKRLLAKESPQIDGFLSSQLNDTAHAARLAMKYLRLVCADIEAVKGGMTAALRNAWRLKMNRFGEGELLANPYLHELQEIGIAPGEFRADKLRLDHRHHAVDAAVIACTTRKAIQNLVYFRNRGRPESRHLRQHPWPEFYADLRAVLQRILVSHEYNARPQGALHKETVYGASFVPGKVTKRMAVGELSLADIYGEKGGAGKFVINPEIRSALRGEIERRIGQEVARAIAGDKKRRSKKIADLARQEELAGLANFRLCHPNGHPIKKVKVLLPMAHPIPLNRGLVATSETAYLEIYEPWEPKHKKARRAGKAVRLWDAAQSKAPPPAENLYLKIHKGSVLVRLDEQAGIEEELQAALESGNKDRYDTISPEVFIAKVLGSDPVMVRARAHHIAKTEIRLANGSTSKGHGRHQRNFNTLKAVRIDVDAAGFITKIYWP